MSGSSPALGAPRPQLPVSPALVTGVALAGSALAGAAMAFGIRFGLGMAVALVYVPLALLNLRLAIVLWLPTVSLIAVEALAAGPNLAGMLLVAGWVGAFASQNSRIPDLVAEHIRLLTGVAVLVLWVMLSIAWAQESPIGGDRFFGWLVAGVIVLLISTTLVDRRYLRLAAGAFVVGASISVLIGLLGGAVQEGSERVVGGSGDPNFLAAGIVPAIVLAVALAAGSPGLWPRFAAVAAVAILTIGLAASESRGGFVAAAVAAVAVIVLAKHHRAWVIASLLAIFAVGAAWFSVDPAAWERISDFTESHGRSELWGVAFQMWQDNPIAGVGLEGFVDHAGGYVRELGALEYAEFLVDEPKVVHNTYLEILAETGLVGFVLFLGVVLSLLRCASRAARAFERVGDVGMAALARATVAGVLAMLASAAFISGATDRRLWVLLAFGPALLACAKRGSPDY